MGEFSSIKVLTFDVFGTILDLGSSLKPFITKFLEGKGSRISTDHLWQQWRARQRIEQYQDTIMMLGHSGYLETARRAFVYSLRLNRVEASNDEVENFMHAWQQLVPFPDVMPALERLKGRYKLVVLSNGDPHFLDHLVRNRIRWDFENVISATTIGAFKPHPGVYRRAATILGLEVGQCMMVSANSFDVVGARACGYKGALVNRYNLPYEDSPYQPDVIIKDFTQLADTLI